MRDHLHLLLNLIKSGHPTENTLEALAERSQLAASYVSTLIDILSGGLIAWVEHSRHPIRVYSVVEGTAFTVDSLFQRWKEKDNLSVFHQDPDDPDDEWVDS